MMKKNLFVLLLALILPLSFVCAENYPYRSDVLWVTVPNHADWIYKTGEKATVEVQFYKYGIPRDGVTVSYEIGGDMMSAETSGYVEAGKSGYSCGNHERTRLSRLPLDSHCGWKKL